MAASSRNAPLRFGLFELDLETGELRKSGHDIRLRPQAAKVLAVLASHPGQLVTREDLSKRLWGPETFVDFEHGLNLCIRQIRAVLDDDADNPRYIETLPRRGYRFIASIRDASRETLGRYRDELDSGTLAAVTAQQRRHPRQLAWPISLLAVTGVVGLLWFVRPAVKAPEPTLAAVPLTTYSGFQMEPNFSPDGNQVAFTWGDEKGDNADIYVKLIDTSGPPFRLTTHPAADYCPSWSPDGRFIAFLRKVSREKSALLLIPALGGPERKLAEISNADFSASAERRLEIVPGGLAAGQNLAWSPDGNSLVISDRDSRREPFALSLLSIETGEKLKLTSPPAQLVGDTSPAFSPDGRALAFSRRIDYGLGDLYLVTFSEGLQPAGDTKRLTFENRGATSPAWAANGHEIVFYAPGGLWKIADPGPTGRIVKPQSLASFGENVVKPAISRRGQRLVYTHLFFNSNIWRIAAPVLDGSSPSAHNLKSLNPVNSAAPFISSTRDDSAPQFSPDGRRIAFTSDRSGNLEIWVCDSDGSNSVQLTSFRGPAVTTPRWSPNGERIAFDSNAEGEYDIWVIGANGGKPQRMTTHPANDGNPSWSRAGGWIYFDSARTGEQQVWKIPADGGEAIQVTRDGGVAPLESPDGKFLYYLTRLTEADLWKIPVQGGQATKVLEGLSNYLNVAIVDNGVYFVPERSTAASSLQFLSFATFTVRPVANPEKPLDLGSGGGVAVSPDGRWIVYTQFDLAGSELMLVENFR